MTPIRDSITAGGYATAWSVIKYLPEPMTQAGFGALASVLTRREGRAVRQLQLNLEHVAPGVPLLDDAVASYLRYWHEVFRLPRWNPERIREGFTLDGVEILDHYAQRGTGVVVVGGHLANWDLAGAWAALRYGSVVSVAERLKPVQLFDQFVAARRALGIDILGLGDPDVMRGLLQRLKDGRIVALLGDRDLTGGGVEIDFFGEPTNVPGGPATLSVLAGVPLLGLQLWYDGPQLRGRISEPISVPKTGSKSDYVRALTQASMDFVAEGIATHPVDWHMMQRVWPSVVAR